MNRDALRGLGDDAHIVGDEHEAHAGVALQLEQEVEDLRLNGDVERGGRLVGNEEAGIAGDPAIITRWLMPPES